MNLFETYGLVNTRTIAMGNIFYGHHLRYNDSLITATFIYDSMPHYFLTHTWGSRNVNTNILYNFDLNVRYHSL